MVAAVIDDGFQVHHRIAGQHPLLHRLDYALFHRRDILPRHPAADHFRAELKAVVPFHRLQPQQHMAVLPVAAGLFLVAVFGIGNAGDGFPVSHPRPAQRQVSPELALDPVNGNLNLRVPQAGEQAVPGVDIPGVAQAGILLDDPGQGSGHLVQVGFGGRSYRHAVVAPGKGDAGKGNRLFPRRQGVAGNGGRQLADGPHIPGGNFGNVFLGLAPRQVKLADALGLATGAVPHFRVAGDSAAIDPEQGKFAHKGVGGGLEYESGQWPGRIHGKLGLFAAAVLHCRLAALLRGREKVPDGVQVLADAEVLGSGAGQNGGQSPGQDGRLGSGDNFRRGQFLPLQILVGQSVIGLGHRLDQPFPGGGELVGHFRRNFRRRMDHADHALEVLSLADRQLERHAVAAETALNIGHGAGKTGVFPVHFVDQQQAGQARFLALLPGAFRAYIHPGSGRQQDSGAFHYPQGADHFAKEVVIARRVQKVGLEPLSAAGNQGSLNAAPPLDFLRFIVGNGVAVLHPADPSNGLGVEQQGLAQGCLAGAAMGQQRHVPQVAGVYRGHSLFSPLTRVVRDFAADFIQSQPCFATAKIWGFQHGLTGYTGFPLFAI